MTLTQWSILLIVAGGYVLGMAITKAPGSVDLEFVVPLGAALAMIGSFLAGRLFEQRETHYRQQDKTSEEDEFEE